MATFLNKVFLVGNIGRKPDLIESRNGGHFASFSLATSTFYRAPNSNEWIQNTEWHRVITFNEKAVQICSSLETGSYVFVEGSLRTRKYTDKQTNTERTTVEVHADSIFILQRVKNEDNNQSAYGMNKYNNYNNANGNFNQNGFNQGGVNNQFSNSNNNFNKGGFNQSGFSQGGFNNPTSMNNSGFNNSFGSNSNSFNSNQPSNGFNNLGSTQNTFGSAPISSGFNSAPTNGFGSSNPTTFASSTTSNDGFNSVTNGFNSTTDSPNNSVANGFGSAAPAQTNFVPASTQEPEANTNSTATKDSDNSDNSAVDEQIPF